MSAQLIEIIFLGAVAFIIISKFLSLLGTTDEDDPARKSPGSSYFGAPKGMKDVTGSADANEESKAKAILKITKRLKKEAGSALEHMKAIYEAYPNFDAEKFLTGAKGAFSMIIKALDEKDLETIEDLVDRRYVDQIKEFGDNYGKNPGKKLDASIIDSYSLGNSIYIKVKFTGSTSKIKSLKEEWVFTKNIQQSGPDWFLCNIER